jgi:DNA-binding transcriptional ArsR family regulator
VALNNITGLAFGLDRNAKYRGLAWLEQAGLVIVERRLGRAPLVTILDGGGDDVRQS